MVTSGDLWRQLCASLAGSGRVLASGSEEHFGGCDSLCDFSCHGTPEEVRLRYVLEVEEWRGSWRRGGWVVERGMIAVYNYMKNILSYSLGYMEARFKLLKNCIE